MRWSAERLGKFFRRPLRLPAWAAVLATTGLLGGCFVGTEHPDAALDVPRIYREAAGRTVGPPPSLTWWRGFSSPRLAALVEQALTSNLDIAVAVARIVQADAQSRVAGAALLPVLDLNAQAVRAGAPGGPERSTLTTSLTAAYEIDFWGQNRAILRSAEQFAVVSRYDREVVALSTAAAVANAYFQLLVAQERLRVARDNIDAAARVLRLIDERFKAGTASALDVAQQESLTNNIRAAIPPLEQTERQNRVVLAVLVGRAPSHVTVGTENLMRVAIPSVSPGLPSDLLVRRPDVRSAEAGLAAANANVEAARAAMLPRITLTGQGGYQSDALRTLLRPESAFFNLAAGLAQPILDGQRLQGQLDLQRGRQDEALQIYRRAVIAAFGDVEQALIATRQTAERERLQREVVRSSRNAFEISEARLREGAVDLVTVLSTQQTLFQAQDQLVQARFGRLQAVVGLFQALGGGWPAPEPRQARRASRVER